MIYHIIDNQIFVIKNNVRHQILEKFVLNEQNNLFFQKYGINISNKDRKNYINHYSIWMHIKKNSIKELCIILENNAKLILKEEDVYSKVEEIDKDWDIIIPENKIKSRKEKNELYPSRLGYYFGSYIYILNSSKIDNLLALDYLNLPIDEKLLDSAFSDKIKMLLIDFNCFDFDENKCPIYLNRNNYYLQQIYQLNVWDEKQKDQALNISKYIGEISVKKNLKLYAHAGTLLGFIRHNDIMPWDDDIDFTMDEKDLKKLIEEVEKDQYINYCISTWQKTGLKYYKFFFRDGEKKEGYDYTFPFVDIWILFDNNKEYLTSDGYKMKKQDYLPGIKYSFEKITLLIPKRYDILLNQMYKDWNKYIKVYSWSHRHKNNESPAFIAKISFGTDNDNP